MAKIICSCSNPDCGKDIEESDIEGGTAEIIEGQLFCFDCAEKYRENLEYVRDNPGLDN